MATVTPSTIDPVPSRTPLLDLSLLPGLDPQIAIQASQPTAPWQRWLFALAQEVRTLKINALSVIQDTHAKRLALPAASNLNVWFVETDRGNALYTVRLVALVPAWTLIEGSMTGMLAGRPADLGANDAGFVYQATDAATYRWNGVAWIAAAIPAGSGIIREVALTVASTVINLPGLSGIWALILTQDGIGGRLVTFSAQFVGGAAIAAQLVTDANTYSALTFATQGSGRYALVAIVTGVAL